MSAVGSLRICGYSKTEPRAVNPAMARRAAAAMAAAARRRVVRVGMARSLLGTGRAVGGDPGGQETAGVVGEVVADQDVEAVGVAGEVGGGDRHQVAGAGDGGGHGRSD